MSVITIFVHILIITIGILTFLYDYRKNKLNKVRIIAGVNLVFIYVYGIIPLILNFNDFFKGKTDFYLVYTVDIQNEPYFFASIMILLGYISFLLGYFLSKPYKISYHTIDVEKKTLKLIGLIILSISCFSIIMVSFDLGGILNSIQYIEDLRSGGGEINVSSVGFMLLPVAIPAFLIFLSLQIEKNKLLSFNFLFLVISFIGSIYYILMFGGRLPFALFVLLFILYFLDKKNAFNIQSIAMVVIIGFFLLNYLESFFMFLSNKENVITKSVFDNIPRLVAQFSFPYINVLKVHSFTYETGEFRYFIDLISWLYNNFIPNKIMDLLGGNLISPSYVVNANNHGTIGIPVDIISFGYYQFAFPGVIIICFIFGKIVGWFDSIFNTPNKSLFITFTQIRVFEILAFYPMYADIEAFMRRRIDLSILIIIILIFSRKVRNSTKVMN